ncbi:MAG: hypothetical protein ABJF89_04370 [Parasphingorhabdus sp.]
MKKRLASSAMMLSAFVFAPTGSVLAENDQPACGMLPSKIVEDNFYAGYGLCTLKQVREQPLWKGLKSDGLVQQSRFTFADGHLRWLWTIRIDERKSGAGRVEITRIGRANGSFQRVEKKRHWHRRISKTDMTQFNQLTREADLWKFENGTWDHDEEEDAIYLHCATLDMENMSSKGFRYSNVNIGCNRPVKLQAALDHVLEISNLDWETIYDR